MSPSMTPTRLMPVALEHVRIADEGFWGRRRVTNRRVTLASQLRQLQETGRLRPLDPADTGPRHPFWDSDIAKWLEAVCDEAIGGSCPPDLIPAARAAMAGFAALQDTDGYLGSWLRHQPEKRYQDLKGEHELYSMGHVLEACCAYHVTGWDDAGDRVARRLVDHLWTTFGPSGLPGYCGHPEIELALMRWWRLQGDERARSLAQLMVDRRGQQPLLFTQEAERRGQALTSDWSWRFHKDWRYYQAHRPVREQTEADGHAVRALYLFAGMTDLALAGDASLIPVVTRLWQSAVGRRMYVTGGVGSDKDGERFGADYDLPDDTAYCETCAAIALARWATRMLSLDLVGEVGDVLELTLHNNLLAGIDLSGERYFYSNPLAVAPHHRRGSEEHVAPERQAWFGCACCPPNVARTLAELGTFAYGHGDTLIAVHLYLSGTADLMLSGVPVHLTVVSGLPWSGTVRIQVQADQRVHGTIALRLPVWCPDPRLTVAGATVAATAGTYVHLTRAWQQEVIELELPLVPHRVFAHPAVRSAAGKVALQRGPLLYALEEQDNGGHLDDVALADEAPLGEDTRGVCGGLVAITATGTRTDAADWDGSLYRNNAPRRVPAPLVAIPYCLWGNRTPGEMRVWVRRT